MDVLQLVYPAAAFTAICFPLSGPVDAALLALSLVLRQRYLFAGILNFMPSREAFMATLAFSSILAWSICALSWVLRTRREEVGTQRWNGPGRVLLFPCRTFHSRLFPKQHSFDYPYLAVGVPVGFEGNAGGMVTVRTKRTSGLFSWSSLLPDVPKAWFTVDPGDYLERGKAELGLRGKLDRYLRSQGVDPGTYPHAYFVTAAPFLGYNSNPTSFWYLYDAGKRLAAMILDVNNTFGERRLYFLTSSSDRQIQSDCSLESPGDEGATFEQSWPKDFHVSPFSSRKGSYTLSACDPLGPFMQGTGSVANTITLTSSKGHPKLVATLRPESAALDPYAMSTYQKFRFLASWWWVGFATFPLILKEAFGLNFRRKLHVWYRPEPLKGTIARTADTTERKLEPIFRRYLQHLVEQSPAALAVKYIASGTSGGTEQVMMKSRAARRGPGAGPEELEFRVLTPLFYRRFVYYAHDFEAFFCELHDSCTIWVSRPDLLPMFALRIPPPPLKTSDFSDYAYFKMVQHLRVRPERIVRPLTSVAKPPAQPQPVDIRNFRISSMDAYVSAHEDSAARETYKRCVLKLFVADRFAFGSMLLLELQRLVVKACLAWFISAVLTTDLGGFP